MKKTAETEANPLNTPIIIGFFNEN